VQLSRMKDDLFMGFLRAASVTIPSRCVSPPDRAYDIRECGYANDTRTDIAGA